jgi:hypothetical protein
MKIQHALIIGFFIILGFAGASVYLVSNITYMIDNTVCDRQKNVITCHLDEGEP